MTIEPQALVLDPDKERSSLFSHSAISSHLLDLGYPQKALNSMLKCNYPSGQFIIQQCDCQAKLLPLTWHCNLRTCPVCSVKRSKRIFRQLQPLLHSFSINPHSYKKLYFLTISPQNYDDFKEGLEHLKASFSKFIRNKYIKERIEGGVWILETKTKNKFDVSNGWNVHLHVIFYGRKLDNCIRGKCLNCGQNYIKQDHISKQYYCANRKCNSKNIVFSQDSKIVSIWKQCSKRDVNIRIDAIKSYSGAFKYILKYVSVNDDSFNTPFEKSQYIYYSYKQKLLNKFGSFFKYRYVRVPCICNKCLKEISFIYDPQVVQLMICTPIPKPIQQNLEI